jgi:hypothetical protein
MEAAIEIAIEVAILVAIALPFAGWPYAARSSADLAGHRNRPSWASPP